MAQVLSLLVADKTGGLSHGQKPGRSKPFDAQRAPAPLTSEEALQQAQAEGLVLRVADTPTGYFGVCLANPGYPKPYHARVKRGGKQVSLGSFATAEEAALCVARTPEGEEWSSGKRSRRKSSTRSMRSFHFAGSKSFI